MCFNYVSEGAVGGGCWIDWTILGEEEIEKREEFSDNIKNRWSDKNENRLSSGAVGCCCGVDWVILGEEEIEKRDEFSENADNRFIWTYVWFAWIGLVYWEVVPTINKYNKIIYTYINIFIYFFLISILKYIYKFKYHLW